MITIHFLISGIEKIKIVQKKIRMQETELNILIFLCRNSDN